MTCVGAVATTAGTHRLHRNPGGYVRAGGGRNALGGARTQIASLSEVARPALTDLLGWRICGLTPNVSCAPARG